LVSSKTLLLVGVIVATYVVSISYYVQAYDADLALTNSVNIYIQIIGHTANSTDTFLPDNFSVVEGQHVTLVVSNGDVTTHGLSISKFNVGTGVIPAGGTVSVTFVPNLSGTFEVDEPSGDCGGAAGASCDSQQLATGSMTVSP